jgi:dihydroorotate dehydrogenase
MKNAYERFVRPLLFSLNPETAHHFGIGLLRSASHVDLALRSLKLFRPRANPKTLFGIKFQNPIGLAAGFDKNGVAIPAWAALGFGFIEVGTVTARPQPGNPKPRIFRFAEQAALINRLGFNNDGADVVAQRLRQLQRDGRWPKVPIGINIGKSKITSLEEANEDYLYSFRALREFADYVVINVSSPNTPGLRALQGRDALLELLRAIDDKNKTARKPILIKIAPDLASDALDEIVTVAEQTGVAGIIATNTTVDHSSIPQNLDQEGGLSGAPLREKSTAIIRAITARSTIPVIASGGIFDAASAREKIDAGAQLLQIYTGLIYRGPGLLREIGEALVTSTAAAAAAPSP